VREWCRKFRDGHTDVHLKSTLLLYKSSTCPQM
jgi:hypothetical protein